MDKKLQVYHFHNGTGGGVFSVIKNLLKFSKHPSIENHIIYTINKDVKLIYSVDHLEGAKSQQVFYYSSKWNFYYTCRQLAKLLPDDKAIIVAHDWLELGMASNLGLQNRVITFLHGDYDYYYQLAQSHYASIDKFIGVADNIAIKLKAILPLRKHDICYLRFPVPSVSNTKRKEQLNNIVFIGRLTEEKGFPLLPVIDSLLRKKNIYLNWHIVGEDNNCNNYEPVWGNNSSIHFYGKINNEDVLLLLQNMDCFILPSIAEGMPVALIEAMKAGVIPLVNNIEGGVQELIKNGITGYKINNNSPELFVDKIFLLLENKILSKAMSENCIEVANKLFDPYKNTRLIEEEICKLSIKNNDFKKMPVRTYGSRLDQPWLDNSITSTIRNRFKKK